MERRALITGITGQDGSYLAEFLLDKGYEVFGLVRRLSRPNLENLASVRDQIELIDGDLLDQSSLNRAVKTASPTEVYHLAAQSYVAASFSQPVLTGEVTALGALRVFEAVRTHTPEARVYQASSSEMFGSATTEPQNEATPFHPRSPYALAKLFAYWAAVGYREAYSMYISNGILYNHECFARETPVIVRDRYGQIDCIPIEDAVPDPSGGVRQSQLGFQVWDRRGFVDATLGTVTWNGLDDAGRIRRISDGRSTLRTTREHFFLNGKGQPIAAHEVGEADSLLHSPLPSPPSTQVVSARYARFAGRWTAAGRITRDGASMDFLEPRLFDHVQVYWEERTGGSVSEEESSVRGSGAPLLRLREGGEFGRALRAASQTRRGAPKVPLAILNSHPRVWSEYLAGFIEGSGPPAEEAGATRISFSPEQACLAGGIWWIWSKVRQDAPSIHVPNPGVSELADRPDPNSEGMPPESMPAREGTAAEPSVQPSTSAEEYTGWVYDVATSSGTLHAGVGDLVVHNSPRRGVEFVTRRVTLGVARIKAGLQAELRLGNLDAQRDWGFAPEYVDLMWRILQQSEPGDFVGATGETHSVREFVAEAFQAAALDLSVGRVVVDPRQTRPADVIRLRGDASKARRVLGWEAKTRFPDLVRIMVNADVERIAGANPAQAS